MALPESLKTAIEAEFRRYCEEKIPREHRNEIRIGFAMEEDAVTLFEERPFYRDPRTWTKSPFAQFRYNAETGKWTLYYRTGRNQWQRYSHISPAKDIDKLLKEVDEDPTGIFWG
jgi:hypothetical protein